MSEVYTWEPSDAALAARYGLPVDRIVRFDTNTSPVPPAFVPSVLQAGPWPLNEYPDSAYQAFTEAAAAYAGAGVQPDEIIVGAGADEILDLIGKAFLPAGGAAVVPGPSYGLYPVITSQRAARRIDVPRSVGPGGWAMDVDGVVRALAGAQVVWLCEPNNPTGSSDGPEAVEPHPGGRRGARGAAGDRGGRGLLRVHRPHGDPVARAVSASHRGAHPVQGLRPARHPGRLGRRGTAHHRPPGTGPAGRQHLHDLGRARRGWPWPAPMRHGLEPPRSPPSGSGWRPASRPAAGRPIRA